MTDIDTAAVMAEHQPWESPAGTVVCWRCGPDVKGPCEPYRLAEALVASEAKVARVEALTHWRIMDGDVSELARALVRALADQPERAS